MNGLNPETRQALIEAARAARAQAYAPYSNFAVGANVENASYSLTICAERAVVFTAITQGARRLRAIALVSATGVPPCGACRQVLSEFTSADFEILVANADGVWHCYLASELWPLMFTKDDLMTAFPGRTGELSQEKEKR